MLAMLFIATCSVSSAQVSPGRITDDRLKTAPFATIKPRTPQKPKPYVDKPDVGAAHAPTRSAAPSYAERIQALDRTLEKMDRIRRELELDSDELDRAAEARIHARLVADCVAGIERGEIRFVSRREMVDSNPLGLPNMRTASFRSDRAAFERSAPARQFLIPVPSIATNSETSLARRFSFEHERSSFSEADDLYREDSDAMFDAASQDYPHPDCDCADCADCHD